MTVVVFISIHKNFHRITILGTLYLFNITYFMHIMIARRIHNGSTLDIFYFPSGLYHNSVYRTTMLFY